MVMNLEFAKYAVLTMMLDDDLSLPRCQYKSTLPVKVLTSQNTLIFIICNLLN